MYIFVPPNFFAPPLQMQIAFPERNHSLAHTPLISTSLLAPTGALVVMMVYYTYIYLSTHFLDALASLEPTQVSQSVGR